VNRRVRTLLLVSVLLSVVVILAGCGIQQGPIDIHDPNADLWHKLVVYPIAEILIFLGDGIAKLGIPYAYGWAIILLTIGIKLVTLPLTRKQLQSTKATQELQPKLKELQAKYGKDRQKLSEEQMKLYKEAGVNPMGGCLPLLIQLPILWGLYQALYVLANPSIGKLTGAPFFWIPDLAMPTTAALGAGGQAVRPESVCTLGPRFELVGTSWISTCFKEQNWYVLFAYFSLPVLMLATQLILQKMSQPAKDPSGGAQEGQQQMMGQMMMFMPIMFGYITLGLPAGLTLYWTTSNILSLLQQYFVTGWGSLVDWIPALKPKPEAPAPVSEAVLMTPSAPE
jgi:YidC/Oxa1 family membrane protein insertase